jgi:hypothetical protein
MKRLLLLVGCSALALAGCAPAIVTASASGCSSLVPDHWKKGVDGAPLPAGDSVGDWITFSDAQTGKLDQANGRTKDAIGIVERCETRDAAAIKRARRGFIGRIFGELEDEDRTIETLQGRRFNV